MVASNRPPGREVRDLLVIATTSRLAGPDSRVVTFSSSASADAGVSLEGDLLATKVSLPHVRRDLVARPGLATRIDDATAYDICLVCSPPGFGKTTALAAWAAGNARPIAWLTLDEDDDLTLVLDDYHVIASPQIQGGVAFLLGHLPCGLRRVIAGRSDPPLPLGELRARGRLAEVRAADLRYSTEETASFLRDLWGLQLPDDAIAALTERTEGWVAGLQLAALSLRHQPDPSAFVAAFAGSHRFVLDYLSEEVVARQPEEMRRFLLTTSILERLSGPLCDALTGHSDGQERLEHAERANLFVVPLDEKRRWYRYHHLFIDLLRRFVSSAQRGYRPTATEEVVGYAIRLLAVASRFGNGHESSVARISGAAVLIEPLTEREGEVLLLLAEGRSNREIGDRLVVTLDTVKKHLTHIFGKLGAVSRTQAVARARGTADPRAGRYGAGRPGRRLLRDPSP